jgi:hypothetical protein
MGTMCVIAAKCKDGYKSISVHYDGYLEGAGALLVRNYNTEAKVKKLIALGDLSSLGPAIGRKFDSNDEVLHNALSPVQCIAYHRDYGRLLWTYTAPTIKDLFHHGNYYCADYVYIWDGSDWWYYRDEGHRRKLAEYKEVQSGIKELDAEPVKDEATRIAESIDYLANVYGGLAATMIEEQFKQHENKLNKQSTLVMYDDLQQYIADRINSLKGDKS